MRSFRITGEFSYLQSGGVIGAMHRKREDGCALSWLMYMRNFDTGFVWFLYGIEPRGFWALERTTLSCRMFVVGTGAELDLLISNRMDHHEISFERQHSLFNELVDTMPLTKEKIVAQLVAKELSL